MFNDDKYKVPKLMREIESISLYSQMMLFFSVEFATNPAQFEIWQVRNNQVCYLRGSKYINELIAISECGPTE